MRSLVLLALLTQADNRFVGGAAPHPLATTGPVDGRPSVIACSVETLRQRTQCLFDGKPAAASDRARQAEENRRIAASVGEAMCKQAIDREALEQREAASAFKACLARTRLAVRHCDLDGAEALLDAEGLFSPRAGVCYGELSAAFQLVSTPAAPPAPGAAPPSRGDGKAVAL